MTIKIDISQLKQWKQLSKEDNNHLDSIAHKLCKSKKVIVVTGAGISCNAGIPDFRSKDGLYNMIKEKYPNVVVQGKDLFDTVLFNDPQSISIFFTFMAQLRKYTLKATPTQTHRFIRLLKDQQKLIRCYTQNIDGLESREGLKTKPDPETETQVSKVASRKKLNNKRSFGIYNQVDLVQLHGDINILKCGLCLTKFEWNPDYEKTCLDGEAPSCPSCTAKDEARKAMGMRSRQVGALRPNIVLYGEEHPEGEAIGKLISRDSRTRPEVLLIIGTSLKVVGLRKLVKDISQTIQKNKKKNSVVVLITQSDLGLSSWDDLIDYHIKCDCDEWVRDLKMRVPDLFKLQTKISDFSTVKLEEIKPGHSSTAENDAQAITTVEETALTNDLNSNCTKKRFNDKIVGKNPAKSTNTTKILSDIRTEEKCNKNKAFSATDSIKLVKEDDSEKENVKVGTKDIPQTPKKQKAPSAYGHNTVTPSRITRSRTKASYDAMFPPTPLATPRSQKNLTNLDIDISSCDCIPVSKDSNNTDSIKQNSSKPKLLESTLLPATPPKFNNNLLTPEQTPKSEIKNIFTELPSVEVTRKAQDKFLEKINLLRGKSGLGNAGTTPSNKRKNTLEEISENSGLVTIHKRKRSSKVA